MKGIVKYVLPFLLVSFFNFVVQAKGTQDPEIKIVATIGKSGYVGQAFTYEVCLLSTSPDISNVRIARYPFYPEDISVVQGVVRNNRPERIQEKGKTFYSWVISRNFIFPGKPGKFRIGAGKYVVFIPHERIISQGFWGNQRIVEYEEKLVECNELEFKVSDLPSIRKGEEFTGCVGDFKIEGWFPPGYIQTGRQAYAMFVISGYGSLEDLKLPNIFKIFNNGCRLMEVEQNDEQFQRDGQLFSQVTLTCSFMPEEDDFVIDPLCLKFFNPTSKKYYDACSEELRRTGQPSDKKKSHDNKDAIAI